MLPSPVQFLGQECCRDVRAACKTSSRGHTAPKNFFSTASLYSPFQLVSSFFVLPPSSFISAIPWKRTQAPALASARAEAMVVIVVGVAGSVGAISVYRRIAVSNSSLTALVGVL